MKKPWKDTSMQNWRYFSMENYVMGTDDRNVTKVMFFQWMKIFENSIEFTSVSLWEKQGKQGLLVMSENSLWCII
jgi:hypothetical protein